MSTAKGNTASGFRSQRPVLTNAADTSRDAERIISQGPAIFANEYGIANVPAPPNRNFSRDQIAGLPSRRGTSPSAQGGQATRDYSVHKGTSLSADEMAAIGYSASDTRSGNPIVSGRPTQNNTRRAGSGNQPRATRRGR